MGKQSHILLIRVETATILLENNLAVLIKIKNVHALWSINSTFVNVVETEKQWYMIYVQGCL